MPIYEYQCESCGHELEALQKMSDPLLKKCPECNKNKLKKMVSAAAFRLKGGGWYETDFKTGKKKNVADAKSPPSSSTPSASETKPSKTTAEASPVKSSGNKSSGKKAS